MKAFLARIGGALAKLLQSEVLPRVRGATPRAALIGLLWAAGVGLVLLLGHALFAAMSPLAGLVLASAVGVTVFLHEDLRGGSPPAPPCGRPDCPLHPPVAS